MHNGPVQTYNLLYNARTTYRVFYKANIMIVVQGQNWLGDHSKVQPTVYFCFMVFSILN